MLICAWNLLLIYSRLLCVIPQKYYSRLQARRVLEQDARSSLWLSCYSRREFKASMSHLQSHSISVRLILQNVFIALPSRTKLVLSLLVASPLQ